MQLGIFGGLSANGPIDEIVDDARVALDEGFTSYWLPQIFGVDALTALAVVGREVPTIELGTAVVPTYPRHPMMLAAQALTTQAITGGRLALGIGLSHQLVIEGMFGMSFEKPVRHMREYLEILMPLVRGEGVQFEGETLTARGALDVKGATPMPVLIAALGPKMLELAGTVADGTVTWMTGPSTIESHIAPVINAAAEKAGRPAPRIGVGLPVCVTDDADEARSKAAKTFEIYGTLPSYRAMLDREGAAGPSDVAMVGTEDEVKAQIEHLAKIGATDLVANIFGSREERTRARALLSSLT